MNGKDVFQFAVRKVPQVIQEVLKENKLSAKDIDWFVLHQANARIVDAVARRLHIGIVLAGFGAGLSWGADILEWDIKG